MKNKGGKKAIILGRLSELSQPKEETVVNVNITMPTPISEPNSDTSDKEEMTDEELEPEKDSFERERDKTKNEKEIKNANERLDNMDYEPLKMDVRALAKKCDKMSGEDLVSALSSLSDKYDVKLKEEEKALNDRVNFISGKRENIKF